MCLDTSLNAEYIPKTTSSNMRQRETHLNILQLRVILKVHFPQDTHRTTKLALDIYTHK